MHARPLLLAIGLALGGSVHAGGLSICTMESDYNLRIADSGVEFHRNSGTPSRVLMHDGQLSIDGSDRALSAADRQRVVQIERGIRALVPEVKLIALDAVELAFGAVVQVAHALGGADQAQVERLVGRLEQVRADAGAQIAASDDTGDWNGAAFEAQIEAMVGELVPVIAGEAAAIAIAAAMSGDESAAQALEQRMERMGEQIEHEVEHRAKDLEKRAEALCPRVAEIDAIEDALELRLADNQPLQLLEASN